jgi:hypothetical protein
MQADDVFDKTKPWQEVVLKYCLEDLSKHEGYWGNSKKSDVIIKLGDMPLNTYTHVIFNLGDMPLNTIRWAFQKEGLRIQFNPYEVAPYVYGAPNVLIPWDMLRQYLVADPPIVKELFEPGTN